MDWNAIEQRLRRLSPLASAAFAARVALRWLPFLTGVQHGILARIGWTRETPFSYWLIEERERFVSAVLFAQVGAISVALGSKPAAKAAFPRRNGSAADRAASSFAAGSDYGNVAIAAATAASAAASATASATAYAAYAVYGAYDDKSTAYAANAAAGCATDAAANFIYRLFSKVEFGIVNRQIESDLATLETHSIGYLLALPLWQEVTPSLWQERWMLFRRQILKLDQSFAVWLPWLEARIVGKPIDLPLLEKWLNLPEEVANESPAYINRYLSTLDSAKECLNRVRTIFIGYGETGKTSLIRTLHGEPVVEGKELMTPGIEIREWDGAGDDIMTHFWDFGGQVMAHATHQFFLRASCLYVVVLSARAEINATEQADYWLQHVQAFGDNAPVLIVGNKDDQTPVHLDMASLQAKYKNVLGFYPLSCTQAQGAYQHKFQAFLHDFRQQLALLGTRQVMFTDAQFKVLQALRQRAAKQAFIAHNEFNDLCAHHQIGQDDPGAREFLLDLLDRLGVVIHFKDLPYLSEHVLNPRWLTYGVYKVMYSHRARLSLQDMVALLADASVHDEGGQELTYPPEKCLFIATAMQRFKLCYPVRHDANQFIIPGLLETDQPPGLKSAGFDKTEALAFKIAFTGFVPRHVMPEMIVERHADIEGDLVWQYGALLKSADPKARALMAVDYQARELSIWVQGSAAKAYLLILRDVMLQILKRLTMQFSEQIRLPRAALLGERLVFDEAEDWAVYQQIESNLNDGAVTFISARGLKYDLPKVAGLYLKQSSNKAMVNNIYGGQQNFNQAGGDMAGDKTFNMIGSTNNGPIVLADQIQGSFNTTTTNANPELAALLQQMLAEIQKLNAKVPAAQVAAITEEAQQLVAESQRAEPRQHWYQASLTGVINLAQKIGEAGGPLLDVAGKVKEFLSL